MWRNHLPQWGAYHVIIQYHMISPENIHTIAIIKTKHVVFIYLEMHIDTYTCMHTHITKLKKRQGVWKGTKDVHRDWRKEQEEVRYNYNLNELKKYTVQLIKSLFHVFYFQKSIILCFFVQLSITKVPQFFHTCNAV